MAKSFSSPDGYCSGKFTFLTFTRADQSARRSRRTKGKEGEHQQPYHCTRCAGFHIGTVIGHKRDERRIK